MEGLIQHGYPYTCIDRYRVLLYLLLYSTWPHACSIPIVSRVTTGRVDMRLFCSRPSALAAHQYPTTSTHVLVLDGTNVLSRAYTVASGREGRRHPPRVCFELWTEYLAKKVSADLVVCVFDNPENRVLGVGYDKKRKKGSGSSHPGGRPVRGPSSRQSALYPYRAYFDGRDGSKMVISLPGQEADGCIVNIAGRLREVDLEGRLHTYIASGDSDLQACLDERASWVEILPYPSKKFPDGVAVHGIQDFRWKEYFEPSAYGAFLALKGKKEAGIGGLGISDLTAAKLVRSYGTIDAMISASKEGKMKSWSTGVRKAFESAEGRKRLERNMAAFSFLVPHPAKTDDDIAHGVAQWVRDETHSSYTTRSDDRVAIHPMFSLHFCRIKEKARAIILDTGIDLCRVSWRIVTESGWYFDAVLDLGENCGDSRRLFIMFVEQKRGDDYMYTQEALSYIQDVMSRRILLQEGEICDPFKLRRADRYLGMLKHCPHKVLLLPVPPDMNTGTQESES
jgi:hypothetical protein